MQSNERMEWFKETRFGMFIHWGLYSLPARGEWVMHIEQIPNREYAQLAKSTFSGLTENGTTRLSNGNRINLLK